MLDHRTTQAPDQRTVTPASVDADLVARLRGLQTTCPILHGTFSEAADTIGSLRKQLNRYRAAMEVVCDELEEDFDTVDGGDGQPAPNKAMRLASELKEAIYGPGGY